MRPAIQIDGLVVRRGSRRVMDGISLDIEPGVITGLLGPSGSGKTTLMRSIVGVQVVESGTITVLDHAAGASALRHKIGYLTQSPSIYPDLTVAENVGYFASIYGLPNTTADRAIVSVGLADQARQLVGTLSGGQHSRASLACALVGDPELLVLDEAFLTLIQTKAVA